MAATCYRMEEAVGKHCSVLALILCSFIGIAKEKVGHQLCTLVQSSGHEKQHSLASGDLLCFLHPKTMLGLTSNTLWTVHFFKARMALVCPAHGQGSCDEGLKIKPCL